MVAISDDRIMEICRNTVAVDKKYFMPSVRRLLAHTECRVTGRPVSYVTMTPALVEFMGRKYPDFEFPIALNLSKKDLSNRYDFLVRRWRFSPTADEVVRGAVRHGMGSVAVGFDDLRSSYSKCARVTDVLACMNEKMGKLRGMTAPSGFASAEQVAHYITLRQTI